MNSAKEAKKLKRINIYSIQAFLAVILISLPMLMILVRIDFSLNSDWEHFKQYLLTDAIGSTLALVFFTLLFSGIIAVLLAVAVALFDFPLKRFVEWILYIPLAIPPYIAAYVYAGMFSYTGFVQRLFRGWGMEVSPGLFDIMNLRGAIFVYSITLYPYIYAVVKAFIENHSGSFIDTARVLGYKPIKLITRVVLPLIRIPLVGGLMLVMMEVISDYGVVNYFNIPTVSSIIFNSWFGMGDTSVSIRLSFYVMLSILAIQVMEELFRGRKKYHVGSGRAKPITPIKLSRTAGNILITIIFLFISVAFLIPVGQMTAWAIMSIKNVVLTNILKILFNTLVYSTLAAVIILIISILIAHSRRWMGLKVGFVLSKLTQLGYSIPGAIIAIGTITIFVAIDNTLYPVYQLINPSTKKLILSTSIIMLVYAFVVRYMAIGFNSVNSAFAKIGVKYNEAARTLGYSRTKAMMRVELPILKKSLISGFILVFIDILKELPLTLLLRPFNYNTLATRAYEYANDERIHEASVPALIIVGISFIAITIFSSLKAKKTR